ncbi:MAG: hypothetical protein QJR08_00395 [Bacillota bacterium]|nr:hypothetical protein [Bacillota bacterium]
MRRALEAIRGVLSSCRGEVDERIFLIALAMAAVFGVVAILLTGR